jgi:hypothetical protein
METDYGRPRSFCDLKSVSKDFVSFFKVILHGNCHKKVMHDFHQNTFSDTYTFLKGTNEFLTIT